MSGPKGGGAEQLTFATPDEGSAPPPRPGQTDAPDTVTPGAAVPGPVVQRAVKARPGDPAEAAKGAPMPSRVTSNGSLAGEERAIEARLARLHLRTGARALARAELETMAGRGELDREALADLAEVRWRTGDLPGGGEAAQAHLREGGEAPIAFVVAVEALVASGRPREARQLAQRFLAGAEVTETTLAALFAGRARSSVWPELPASQAEAEALVARGLPPSATDVPAVEAAIADGELDGAAARLGVLLRGEPGLAPAALSLAERALAGAGASGAIAAQLHLVRGDAFRLLGRDHEAAAAFQRARQALEGPTARGKP